MPIKKADSPCLLGPPFCANGVTHEAAAWPVLPSQRSYRSYLSSPGHAPYLCLMVRASRVYRVRDAITELGIETYLPLIEERVRWSDRSKIVLRPLFPGYLFVRASDADQLASILQLRDVLRVLPFNRDPEAIEIESLRLALASRVPVTPGTYVAGQRVTIAAGPLKGVSGRVVRSSTGGKHPRLFVGVEMLGRGIEAEVDADSVDQQA
jgi:transcription antitermination factor NusG